MMQELSGPVRDTPPPYRAPICLVFRGYRASIAEIPLLRRRYRTSTLHALQGGNAQKRGRGYRVIHRNPQTEVGTMLFHCRALVATSFAAFLGAWTLWVKTFHDPSIFQGFPAEIEDKEECLWNCLQPLFVEGRQCGKKCCQIFALDFCAQAFPCVQPVSL